MLCTAVFEGHHQVAKLLLESGAEVNALTDDKRTPLFQAAFKGQLSCVELLLKHGADPTIPNDEGKTPAQVATTDSIRECIEAEPATKKRKLNTEEEPAN